MEKNLPFVIASKSIKYFVKIHLKKKKNAYRLTVAKFSCNQ